MSTYGRQRGGGGSAFGSDALFRADFDALIGPGLLSDSFYDTFLDSNTYDISLGTNPAVRDDTYTGGVLTAPNGGASSAYVFEKNMLPSTAGQKVIANPRTATWGVGGHCAFALSPTGAVTMWVANLSSNVDDQVSLRIAGGTSTTQLQMFCDGTVSGSGTSTGLCNAVGTIGSGITVGANTFYRFLIGWNPATGVMTCGVNGVSCGTLTPGNNMPTKAMSPSLLVSGLANVARYHGLWCGWA